MTDDDSNEKGGIDEESYEGDEDNDELNNEDEDPNLKFHYIITEQEGFGEEIPQYTKLKNPLPRENPLQYKRSFPAALRSHKVKKDNNPHKYFLSIH